MSFECYRRMLEIYGAGNVSTCGFSSGSALAICMASHNNAIDAGLAQPRYIVAVSPGEVPWNDSECARMQALNARDVMIDCAYIKTAEGYMRHGEAYDYCAFENASLLCNATALSRGQRRFPKNLCNISAIMLSNRCQDSGFLIFL